MSKPFIDDIRISAAFWLGLQQLGLSAPSLLRQSRLPLTVFTEQKMVTTRQYFALWQAITDISNDEAAGIKLSMGLPTNQFPPSMLDAYHARDYRDSLQRILRYTKLCNPEHLQLHEEGNRCHIEFKWLHAEQMVPTSLVDATMTGLLELGRRGTGVHINAQLLELARPKMDVTVHEAHFGCHVRFGRERNCLHLSRTDLDRPFLSYNNELLELLTPALDRQFSEYQRKHSLRGTVSWLLERQLSAGRPDMLAIAKDLGVSERTLQRRLAGEGCNFQGLLTSVRRARAYELLINPSLDLAEVAFLLGYEDHNSFFRAFRLWEGKTPSHWRTAYFTSASITP